MVSKIQPGQTFSCRPPTHLDTIGENDTPTALKGCGVKMINHGPCRVILGCIFNNTLQGNIATALMEKFFETWIVLGQLLATEEYIFYVGILLICVMYIYTQNPPNYKTLQVDLINYIYLHVT